MSLCNHLQNSTNGFTTFFFLSFFLLFFFFHVHIAGHIVYMMHICLRLKTGFNSNSKCSFLNIMIITNLINNSSWMNHELSVKSNSIIQFNMKKRKTKQRRKEKKKKNRVWNRKYYEWKIVGTSWRSTQQSIKLKPELTDIISKG